MNSSDTEEITDEIIGEAVLALLKTNRPITTPTLLVRLRLMQATESDLSLIHISEPTRH